MPDSDTPNLEWVLNSALGVSIITTDREGLITAFSRGAERMLGDSASEVIGLRHLMAFHDPGELQAHACALEAERGRPVPGFDVFSVRLEPDQVEEREWTYVRKDGSTLRVLLSLTQLRTSAGHLFGYLGTALDITQRLQSELALRQEKHLIDKIINSLPGLFYLFDSQLRARRWNQNTETLLGFSAEELEGKYLGLHGGHHRPARHAGAGCGLPGQTLFSGGTGAAGEGVPGCQAGNARVKSAKYSSSTWRVNRPMAAYSTWVRLARETRADASTTSNPLPGSRTTPVSLASRNRKLVPRSCWTNQSAKAWPWNWPPSSWRSIRV
jgi:PAS domain S-box-containing protein